MKIVAFMQNPWFKPGTPDEVIVMYNGNQEYHRQILQSKMSGRRLALAFGQDLFDEIWWDNANPKAGSKPSDRQPFDVRHMVRVIKNQAPNLIITFGHEASLGMQIIMHERLYFGTFLTCHHPNARGKSQRDLNNFATMVREVIQANGKTAKAVGSQAQARTRSSAWR